MSQVCLTQVLLPLVTDLTGHGTSLGHILKALRSQEGASYRGSAQRLASAKEAWSPFATHSCFSVSLALSSPLAAPLFIWV